MLVSELITWCNKIYEPDETSDFEITDSTWLLFFNECLNNIRPYTNKYVSAYTDLVDGTEQYALPTALDVLNELYICENTDSDDPVYKEMRRVKEETILGYGEYYLWNKTVTIADPEKDVSEGLKIYYYSKASDIEETTEDVPIDDPYILGYYALSRVELADRNTDDYAVHKSEYEDRLYTMKSKIGYDINEMESGW